MANITIRRLDDRLKGRLQHRAAQHGRSMEEEVRTILREVLESPPNANAADIGLQLFGSKLGVELELPPRRPFRKPPDLGDA